jgi:acetoin utilization protein AcuB
MLIADVMKTKLVTVSSTTSLAEARKIMNEHNIRRLPVIDRSHLEGIVTKDDLDKMGPSKLTTFSVHELVYMLNKITVKEVMHRDVVTVPPDTTIEEAVAIAQSKHIGSLLIVDEKQQVIGIATTNDIFIAILNPLLGIGLPGTRIVVINCYKGEDIEKVISTLNKLNITITNLFVSEFPVTGKHDLFIHLATENVQGISEAIQKSGFSVVVRKR